MQLKNLGLALSAKDVDLLKISLAKVNTELATRIVLNSALSSEDKVLLLMERGLTQAAAEQAVATGTLAGASGTATVAAGGLRAAFQGLWATMLANPFVAILAGLAAVSIGIAQYNKKMQESRQEIISQGNTAYEEQKKLQELKIAYDEANAQNDESVEAKKRLDEATNILLESLGYERAEIEKLRREYESFDDVLNRVTIDTLKHKNRDILDSVISAEEYLMHDSSVKVPVITFNRNDKTTSKLLERLEADPRFNKDVVKNLFGSTYFNLDGREGTSVEDYQKALEDAESVLDLIEEHSKDLDQRDVHSTDLWKHTSDFIDSVKDDLDAINSARDNFAESLVNLDFAEGLQSGKYIIPKTAEEYYNLRDSLLAAADASTEFKDTQASASETVDKLLSGYSFSKEFASEFNEFEHNFKNASDGLYDSLVSKAKDASVDIKAYIQEVFDDPETGLSDWAQQFHYTLDDIVTHFQSMREEVAGPIVDTQQSNAALDAFRKKISSLRIDVVRAIGLGLEFSKDQTEEYYRWLNVMGYLDGEADELKEKAAQLRNEFKAFFAAEPPWKITDKTVSDRLTQAVTDFKNIQEGIKTGKFGNIDVFDREANFRIEWDENNLKRFKSELEEMGQSVEDLKGEYSTIFGSWDTFEGVDIAFTPILNVENESGSKEAILLSQDTVNEYISKVLEEAKARGNGELTADLILKVDSEGVEGIDAVGYKLHGLIAAVGPTAELTSMLMHDVAIDAEDTAAALLMVGEYLEYATESAMGYIRNVIGAQITDFASLRDELQLTAEAWQEYQNLIAGGDPSDWANHFEEAYSKAMTDIANGRPDTPAVWGAAKLFFSDEQLAAMGWDLQRAAQELRNSFFTELFSDPEGMEDADKLDIGAKFLNWLNKNKDSLKSASFDVDASGMFNFTYDSEEAFAKELGISTEALTTLLKAMDAFGAESMRSKEDNDKLVESFERMYNIVNAASDVIDGNLTEALSGAFDGLSDEEIQQKVENIKKSVSELGNVQTVLNEFARDLRVGGMQENHIMDIFQNMKSEIEQISGADLSPDDTEFKAAIAYANEELDKLDKEEPTPSVDLDTSEGERKADAFRTYVDNKFSGMNYSATVTPVMDEAAYNNIKSRLSSLSTVTPQTGGGTGAHASGTRNAPGGTTLVNELGPELISDNGVAYIANGGKPGFTNLGKGAIVFNAAETRQIFSNEYPDIRYPAYSDGTSNTQVHRKMITGMMVPGKAFVSQSGFFPTASIAKKFPTAKRPTSTISSPSRTPSSSYNYPSSYGDYGSYNDYSTDEPEEEPQYEKIDWIAILLDRIQRSVSSMERIASSGFKALSTRLDAAKREVSEITREIAAQESGYARYMQEASNVGLPSSIAKRVRDGTINIVEYDEDTRELISEYQEWYEKALDCKDAVEDLHQEIAKLYQDMFNNTQTDFDNQLSLIEHSVKMVNTNISAASAQGYLDSVEYYKQLTSLENDRIIKLNNELDDLNERFSDAMSSGEIEEYSEAWYSMVSAINSVEESIADANVKLLQYQKTMRSIQWSYFDFAQERFNQLNKESNFLIGIMANDKLFDDMGKFDKKGTATMGLRVMNYNAAMVQADEYAKELLKIEEEIAKNPYDTELIKRRETLLGLQQQSIQAAESEKDAIKNLVSQGIQLELNALKELIDSYEESLDSAKDLYDYQKKISQKTGDIAKIEKQLVAYQNDTSEENRARVQKLQEQLKSAREDLSETEWERSISDQKKLLGDFYDQYEDYLNERLDNLESLVQQMVNGVNLNAEDIAKEIRASAEQVGYTITDGLAGIIDDGSSAYYDKMFDGMTSVTEYLDSINRFVEELVNHSDSVAKDSAKSKTDSESSVVTSTKRYNHSVLGDDIRQDITKDEVKFVNKSFGQESLVMSYADYADKVKNGTLANEIIYWILNGRAYDEDTELWLERLFEDADVEKALSALKKVDFKTPFGFSTGGLADYTGLAMLHGTKQKPELVLNAGDTENILAAAKLMQTPILSALSDKASLSRLFDVSMPQNRGDMNIGDININIEHVQDYNDFVSQLRDDPKFEKLIGAMTFDRMDGKSSFGGKNRIKFN